MHSLSNISESEKTRILLMHKSYSPKRNLNESQSLTIDELLKEFRNELEFQTEVHLFRLSISEENEKISYLTQVQDNLVSGLFKSNLVIKENYENIFKPLILESVNDFSNQIRKFNDFLFESLVFDLNRSSKVLIEQNSSRKVPDQLVSLTPNTQPNYTPSQIATTTNGGQTGRMKVKDISFGKTIDKKLDDTHAKLASAVDYIKKNGVGYIFENIRKALLSGVGALIQAALSFTGVGAIANEVVWGIMTLYDLYQLATKKVGALANVVIDLICLLTAGNLGKVLSKWVGFGGTSIKSILQSFMEGGIGKYLTPIIGLIERGAGKISQFLKAGARLAEEKMGIKWLTNLVNNGVKWFQGLASDFKSIVGTGVAKVGGNLIRAGVRLGEVFEAKVFTELSKKSEQELAKLAGQNIEKSVLKAVEKEANENLREKPTKEALEFLDKKFGTKFGNLYALYLGGKKLASHQSKITGDLEVTDVGSDAFRGSNTLLKGEKQAKQIQKALGGLG